MRTAEKMPMMFERVRAIYTVDVRADHDEYTDGVEEPLTDAELDKAMRWLKAAALTFTESGDLTGQLPEDLWLWFIGDTGGEHVIKAGVVTPVIAGEIYVSAIARVAVLLRQLRSELVAFDFAERLVRNDESA